MKPKSIAILAVSILAVVILIQNMHTTRFSILFWEVLEVSIPVLVLGAILIGWIIGWFTHMAYSRGKNKRRSAQSSQSEPPAQTQAGERQAADEMT